MFETPVKEENQKYFDNTYKLAYILDGKKVYIRSFKEKDLKECDVEIEKNIRVGMQRKTRND